MRSSPTDDMLSALVVGREEPGFSRGFGKYELLERVGTGGMAEVFRAVVRGAEGFEKEVCIKRILPMFTEDEDFVRMFIDEAALASKLHHANIVQTLDFDKIDGQYYIALEFVEGRDLKRVLNALKQSGRAMPVGIGAFIGAEILKGLHFAHARRHSGQALGVIHRDISPHNVLVSMSGEVKITDFGIAKAASRVSATKSGVVKGKILYMSPEQAGGGTVDHRADLFAAGVVLYEVLTGKRPFAADTDAESLAKIARGAFTPARTVRPDLPERLDAVVSKLLAKVPSERYSSGGDALRDLGPEVPADGAMQLGELMSALLEGPVPIARRVVTEILDIEKARPVAFEPAVVPADSKAVTRTRGPREEPSAIAFLDTQVAATKRAEERPSLGSDILPSVPTVVSGPPEDMRARESIPPTGMHDESALLAAAAVPVTGSFTAPETPKSKPSDALAQAPLDSTPAAWSFSAETTGTGPVRGRSRRPLAVMAASIVLALCVGGYLLTRPTPTAPTGETALASPPGAPLPPLAPRATVAAPGGTLGSSPSPLPVPSDVAAAQPEGSVPSAGSPSSIARSEGASASTASPPAASPAAGSPPAVAQPATLPSAPPPTPASSPAPPRATTPTKAGARVARRNEAQGVAAPAERAAPPAPPEPAFASVIINAQPWAHVKVNGRSMGETPVGPVRVPAGTVRILLEREGRPPLTRTITVAPGEERSLSVPFP